MAAIKAFLTQHKKLVIGLSILIFTSLILLLTLQPKIGPNPYTPVQRNPIGSLVQNIPLIGKYFENNTNTNTTSTITTINNTLNNTTSSGRRIIGKFQSLSGNILSIKTPDGTIKQFSVDENTQYVTRVPLPAAPDQNGFIPVKDVPISPQLNLKPGAQIIVSWYPIGSNQQATLVVLL